MAEALGNLGEKEKVVMRAEKEEKEVEKEEVEKKEEEEVEESKLRREKEQELTGRGDGWFVVKQAVDKRKLRKDHAMSLQAVAAENGIVKDLMRSQSHCHSRSAGNVVETREPDVRSSEFRTQSWTQTIRKKMGKVFPPILSTSYSHPPNTGEDAETDSFPLFVPPSTPKAPHRDSGIETELEKAVDDLENTEERRRRESNARAEKRIKLEDMLETEKRFLVNLEKLIKYKEEAQRSRDDENHPLPMPEKLREGRDGIAFGNIMKIAEFHRDIFTQGLCDVLHDPKKLKDFLVKREREIKERYERYCVNKPKSECVVKEYDWYFRKLQHRLEMDMSLADLLIKPVQALTRYHMFFEDLARLSEKASEGREAEIYLECAEMANKVSRGANNMMIAGKIKGFTHKGQGELLKNGKATCKQRAIAQCGSATPMGFRRTSTTLNLGAARRWEPAHIFLFENCVIVCKEGKNNFDLWHQFQINRLTLRDICGDNLNESKRFELHDAPPNGVEIGDQGEYNMTVEVATQEERQEWVNRIQAEIVKLKNAVFDLAFPGTRKKPLL